MLNQIDLSRFDLNLLVVFEAVLAERHVGRAAERLKLSPSAVSHALGRLRRLLQDPLFLRNPKGVVPTVRATELAGPIADILARIRGVVASAERFDPATSTRRFTVGASDGISAVLLPPLLAEIGRLAPGVCVAVRNVLPPFEAALADLDLRVLDLAIVPLDEVPARFAARTLYEERFVIAARAGHPLGASPSLSRYAAAGHVVVSDSGDPLGVVDRVLAGHGLTRRVALTAPNFMLALAVVAATDLVAAVPERIVSLHAAGLGVVGAEPPAELVRSKITAVAPRAALADAGVAWLLDLLEAAARSPPARL